MDQPTKSKKVIYILSALAIVLLLAMVLFIPSPEEPTEEMPIKGYVIEDLVDSEGVAHHFVLRFYKENTPVSDFIAIPKEYIVVDQTGQVGVGIYIEEIDEAVYVAEVVEEEGMTISRATPGVPPFIDPSLPEGVPCFTTASRDKIAPCSGSAVLEIDWVPYAPNGEYFIADDQKSTKTRVYPTKGEFAITDENYFPLPVIHKPFSLPVNVEGILVFGSR